MFSTEKRAEDLAQKNSEIRENKEQTKNILETYGGSAMMASLAQEGGPIAKRIARELRRYESTGRVSNWLAGQTAKAESLREIPNSAVDISSARGRQITAFLPTGHRNVQPFNGQEKYKPEILAEGGGGGTTPAHPWKITIEDQRPEGVNNPVWKCAIESSSRLFNGFGGPQVAVSGADGVFRNVEYGFYFIEVDFSDGDVDQAQIQINNNIGDLVVTSGDPPQQTKLRQQIGYVYLDNDIPKAIQSAWHNFSLFDICLNGVPAKTTIAT